MTDLQNKLDEWQKVRALMDKIKEADDPARRKLALGHFYEGIRGYWEKYKEKFDYQTPPKSI